MELVLINTLTRNGVCSFSAYNHLHHPSKLVIGAGFHCFKYKIKAKLEDPVCANGGKWTVTLSKGKFDTSWLNTLLAWHWLDSKFDRGAEICGAIVSVRTREEGIARWTKNDSNEAAQMALYDLYSLYLSVDQKAFIMQDIAVMGSGEKLN